MVKVGEESGKVDDMMTKVAEYYEDEIDAAVTKLITLVEPLMIMAVVLLLVIVVSMILPIFTMYQNFAN